MDNRILWLTNAFISKLLLFWVAPTRWKRQSVPCSWKELKLQVVYLRPEILFDGFVVAASESGCNVGAQDGFGALFTKTQDLEK